MNEMVMRPTAPSQVPCMDGRRGLVGTVSAKGVGEGDTRRAERAKGKLVAMGDVGLRADVC